MNVLLVSNLYPPYVLGGAELIASYLANGLAEQGNQVTVVTTDVTVAPHGQFYDRPPREWN